MGHLNSFFSSTGGNLTSPSTKVQMPGGLTRMRGMLNFRIDRRIITDVIYSLKHPRYSVTLAVSADRIKAIAS